MLELPLCFCCLFLSHKKGKKKKILDVGQGENRRIEGGKEGREGRKGGAIEEKKGEKHKKNVLGSKNYDFM